MNARYATTLGVLRDLTAKTADLSQQAAKAAQFASESSEQCLTAAKQAAAVPVIAAAKAAVDTAKAAAYSTMCLQASIQMVSKMSMEVACANFHSLDQRVAKWLLIRHDHHRSDPIRVTHQSIADSLGVRREAITLILRKMRGLSFSRGAIKVVDREMLEHSTCECYAAQRQVHAFQMPLSMFEVP